MAVMDRAVGPTQGRRAAEARADAARHALLERDVARDFPLCAQRGDGLEHRGRAAGVADVERFFRKRHGHKAVDAVAAVVRRDGDLAAELLKILLEQDGRLRAEAEHRELFARERGRRREHRRGADAAADERRAPDFQIGEVEREAVPERAEHVHRVAHRERREFFGPLAADLEYKAQRVFSNPAD